MDAVAFSTWRKRLGITQEDLAERWAGVTRNTIQNWESGASAIPTAVETACTVWERRLKQENPALGPVTLVYADGPMFIDPYVPRRRLAMMHQEPLQSNTAAIARVVEMWGRDDFHNAFIIEKSGSDLWNIVELGRVVAGEDAHAPTLPNLLSRLAKHLMETSSLVVRSGPRLPSAKEAKAHRALIETLASKLEDLAKTSRKKAVRYHDIEDVLNQLRQLGKFPPDALVFGIAQAFGGSDVSRPALAESSG
jgi:DNA-binding XRE family transcriptional regulator